MYIGLVSGNISGLNNALFMLKTECLLILVNVTTFQSRRRDSFRTGSKNAEKGKKQLVLSVNLLECLKYITLNQKKWDET